MLMTIGRMEYAQIWQNVHAHFAYNLKHLYLLTTAQSPQQQRC